MFINRQKYMRDLELGCRNAPKLYLQYATITMGSSLLPELLALSGILYDRAKKYFNQVETANSSGDLFHLQCVQPFLLIGLYEFRQGFFPQSLQSAGRVLRAAMMQGLQQLDAGNLYPRIQPISDTIYEEKARTFWIALSMDRLSTVLSLLAADARY